MPTTSSVAAVRTTPFTRDVGGGDARQGPRPVGGGRARVPGRRRQPRAHHGEDDEQEARVPEIASPSASTAGTDASRPPQPGTTSHAGPADRGQMSGG
jgi:hypothetical protein